MRVNDQQLGKPETIYKDTKANIEALASPVEGMIAYATDTDQLGYYNGTTWYWFSTSGTTDNDAIHDNVAGEISLITEKATPVSADLLLIEDSAAANAKKKVQIGNLPTGSDSAAIHDNVASEIHAITEKTVLANDDEFIIEDSADSYNKKRVKKSSLGGGDLELVASWDHSTNITSIDLTIPSSALADFESLLVVIAADTDKSADASEGLRLRFSTGGVYDAGTNYARRAEETGDAATTEQNYSGDCIWIGRYAFPGANADANVLGMAEFYITGFNKTGLYTAVEGMAHCFATSARFRMNKFYGMWKNTGNVDGIRIYTHSASNFLAGSSIRIYGLKK